VCQVTLQGDLSPIEERVRQFLVERAKKTDPVQPFNATIRYGDLCGTIDPDQAYFVWPRFRGIGPVLGRVSTYEHRQGRPMLSALVVQAATLRAGDGFADLGRNLGELIQPGAEQAFWRGQVEAVVQYWTGPGADEPESDPVAPESDPVAKARALLATMRDEIEEISRLLSTV
jgi:hypothetical protein